MDLSPELFETVTFNERWRGYDPADVDDFLERVAVAVGDLQARVREANERISMAERRAREHTDADESMKRTLVIAQRTADQVLTEADEEAARITGTASKEADDIVRRAHQEAARVAEEAQRRLRDDLRALERARDRLRADVAALERFTEGERTRLRDELRARLAELDDPATLRLGAAPEVRAVDVPPEPTAPQAPQGEGSAAEEAAAALRLVEGPPTQAIDLHEAEAYGAEEPVAAPSEHLAPPVAEPEPRFADEVEDHDDLAHVGGWRTADADHGRSV